jgi:hypothetical protein
MIKNACGAMGAGIGTAIYAGYTKGWSTIDWYRVATVTVFVFIGASILSRLTRTKGRKN